MLPYRIHKLYRVPAPGIGGHRAGFQHPRGMAFVLVMIVVALATILGYAMLSQASLQAQISENLLAASCAESLAESGVSLAMIYLQNPTSAPSLNIYGYWDGADAISLGTAAGTSGKGSGSGVPVRGTVDVKVYNTDAANKPLPTNTYRILATGNSGAAGSTGGVYRVIVATVLVNPGTTNLAARFSSGVTLLSGWKVTGDIETSGTLKVQSGGQVLGWARARNIINNGYIQNSAIIPSTQTVWVPTATTVHAFMPATYTYTYNGLSYAATKLNAPSLPYTIANNTTLGPTALNPLGIYWADTDVTALNNVTINGVLIVRGAGFLLRGNNTTFNAPQGWPALLVDNDLTVEKNNFQIVINGLAWIGGNVTTIKTSTSSSYLTINGSLLVNGSTGIDPNFDSTVTLNWDPKAAVAWFGITATPPWVKVLSWKS